ncbi:MAG: hypothetical protein BTN85_0901 [Candidatus Methanohalarchaeum thermophilum]|uniref:Uncharacterized protein n=1 Tax=Methanohalarchaeum thermophilum TaxID=1903181 RepID=A0A1Q6DVK9_METT1|nr:MAG: hypothetical protein BTN85_0901 [Candidatus Methanohalarchaeum thermophilum]
MRDNLVKGLAIFIIAVISSFIGSMTSGAQGILKIFSSVLFLGGIFLMAFSLIYLILYAREKMI